MTIEEILKSAEETSDKWWNSTHKDNLFQKKSEFYKAMMQDLRAIGKTDEEIWHEFITEAFIYGFCEAHKDEFEKENKFNPYSDVGRVASIFERMQPGFKEEHPPCINKHGHYFKTCGQCFTMVCRRCGYKTVDIAGQMTTTYGDFSGSHAPYDRYCCRCEVLLQRGYKGWILVEK